MMEPALHTMDSDTLKFLEEYFPSMVDSFAESEALTMQDLADLSADDMQALFGILG